MKRVVLAFSGGLDTSFCIPWLREQGYAVYAVAVDTGGFSPADRAAIRNRALQLGAVRFTLVDARQSFYDRLVSYIIKANVLRGGVYPLCVGPERIVQAIEVVRVARRVKADALCHGSTGAGNDQVRFDVAFRTLAPDLPVLTPIRDLDLGRAAEAEYLTKCGLKVGTVTRGYSVNQGMLGTTIGGKETRGSWGLPPDKVYRSVVPAGRAPKRAAAVIISFERGLPKRLNGRHWSGPELFTRLGRLAGRHGVGRGVHLGNTIIGIKGRLVFEAPAALTVIKAHQELEKLVLTKSQLFWKNIVAEAYGGFLHEALYFDPVVKDMEAMIDRSQERVTGDVGVRFEAGNLIVFGTRSPYSLLEPKVAVYGEGHTGWTGQEAAGFAKLYGLAGALAARAGGAKQR